MPTDFLVFLFAGAFAGGFINGLAGFGTSLFALVWWLQILPPVQAVALSLFMSVASGVPGMMAVRRQIRAAPLGWFLVPALAGVPIGLYLLRIVDADVLKGLVAVLLLVFSLYFLTRSTIPKVEGEFPAIDAGLGFMGGILGAVAGLSGALPTMWLAVRSLGKLERRAILQPFNVAILGISALILAAQGVYDREALLRILIALPVTMLASFIGLALFRRLSDEQHRRLMVLLLLASGIMIIARSWI
jgi:uncharacterized membrane protein YfcA